MSAPEEEEETILEYAEYYGLASNSCADESLDAEFSALQVQLAPLGLDDSHLFQVPHQVPKFPEIRITLDKGSALLLRTVNQDRAEHDPWAEIFRFCKSTRRNARKIDLPLLRTDPDADLVAFKAQVQESADLADQFLPSEPLDGEKGEGLLWPSHMYSLSATKMADLDKEQLLLSEEDLRFFFEALIEDWGIDNNRELLKSQHTYQRNTAFDTVTPPLSPVFFPDFEPHVPPSPYCVLPLLSDPASLLSADQKAVEQKIFGHDTLAASESSSQPDTNGDLPIDFENNRRSKPEFEELESLSNDEHFPAIERQKKEDLVIENGLTPPMPTPTYLKTVTFSDHVDTMLLDDEYSNEELTRADSRNAGIMAWDASVDDALKAASERANNKLEHEQLQEAATTKKVDVPPLDFPSPCLPWKEIVFQRLTEKVHEYQQNLVSDALESNFLPSKVHGLHRLQESLRWAPFPADLAGVALAEDLEGRFDSFIGFPASVITSGDITFNNDVLKCLEEFEDEGDEDLEAADFVDHDAAEEDMDSLIKKRRHQWNGGIKGCAPPSKQPKNGLDAHDQSKSHKRDAAEMNDNFIGSFDFYSATSALDNFMEARGKKKPRLTDTDYFSTSNQIPRPKHQLLAPTVPAVPVVKSIALPLPIVNAPSNPTPFIISTTLMQIRPVVKTITSLYPTAQLIERDFSKHNESLWMKGTVKRSPVVSPLASEADIILSPSVGVVMTTLAKIKQKPLPGQKTKVITLEKIEGVAQRYARIIVFVSEGSADDSTRNLNGQDGMAYAEFVGFCSAQETVITPIYVPGGPQALGTWIASAMVQHGIHDGSQASLMEDETIWELFLRRCGMNAYAAQSVIAAMRAPEGVDSSSPNKAGMFGLPGFVQMDHAERVRQFSTLLEGTRVLERVSASIDTPWRPPTPMMVPGLGPPALYENSADNPRFL